MEVKYCYNIRLKKYRGAECFKFFKLPMHDLSAFAKSDKKSVSQSVLPWMLLPIDTVHGMKHLLQLQLIYQPLSKQFTRGEGYMVCNCSVFIGLFSYAYFILSEIGYRYAVWSEKQYRKYAFPGQYDIRSKFIHNMGEDSTPSSPPPTPQPA